MDMVRLDPIVTARDYFVVYPDGVEFDELQAYYVLLHRCAAIGGIQKTELQLLEQWPLYMGASQEVADRLLASAKQENRSFETLISSIQDNVLRRCLLRDLIRLSLVDSDLAEQEWEYLKHISKAMNVSEVDLVKLVGVCQQEIETDQRQSSFIQGNQ